MNKYVIVIALHRLLSTRERLKILSVVLYKKDDISITNVSREAKVSKSLVSNFFKILLKEKILKKKGRKFMVNDTSRVKALKILFNLYGLNGNLFKKFNFVRGAGIYGSFLKGENDDESDIDMWILIDDRVNQEEIARLSKELKRKYGNVSPLYLTENKLKELKEKDKVFYYSLIFGSINIYGEKIE